MEKFDYYNNCVNWPVQHVNILTHLTENNIEITRKTFLKHVKKEKIKELEVLAFGYAAHHNQGLAMSADYHVTYHRGKTLLKQTAYFFIHSAIEYVFLKNGILLIK